MRFLVRMLGLPHILTTKQNKLQQQFDALLQRSKHVPQKIGQNTLKAFCMHIFSMFEEAKSGFTKEYLKLFVDEIVVNGKKITITGNADNMASYLEKKSAHDGLTTGAITNQKRVANRLPSFFVSNQPTAKQKNFLTRLAVFQFKGISLLIRHPPNTRRE